MAAAVYQQANGISDDQDQEDLFGGDDLDFDMELSAANSPLTANSPPSQAPNAMGAADDDLNAFLDGEDLGGVDINALNDRVLEVGEKADDAVDYEDIDLSDEEEPAPQPSTDDLLPGIEASAFDDLDDDLFGPSSPVLTTHEAPAVDQPQPPSETTKPQRAEDQDSDLASEHDDDDGQDLPMLQPDLDDIEDAQYRIQLALFAQSAQGTAPTTHEENIEEWLKLEFSQFKRDEAPYWNRLFPPRPHKWLPPATKDAKAQKRQPKQLHPTKVNLEIEPDQRTAFNSAIPAAPLEFSSDLVWTHHGAAVRQGDEEEEEASGESDVDEPLPGGITMQDLEFMCTDFDTLSQLASSDVDVAEVRPRIVDDDGDILGLDGFDDFEQPRKKRRVGADPHDIITIHHLEIPILDNPERRTAKLAAKVVLDLNDRDLLVEEVDLEALKAKARPGEKNGTVKTLKDRLAERFKTSNDAEYDLLKQNHQHKVRGQLTHLNIEHSVPAVRLQYPYYQVKLPLQELRNFHRKKVLFKHPIYFSRPQKHKRKSMKGRTVKDIFTQTRDLSMADNSSTVLLEYSEEHPLMMSQTGMGNKIVNYYRRRTKEDTARPKGDIGETSVLLPEDKSPFYNFGAIDPGETVTALYNSMYRAPIFPQDGSKQDFLIVRESTGQGGQQHYLRNLEHVYVVGQELPSTTIPGTHSRMVTTTAKNRLKAISFRLARKKKSQRIRVEEVTRHFPDTTDMQNRQKMKEFMSFNKEHKEWEMRSGESIPGEDVIQTLIRPEDICLLDSMQVGAQYLQDAGYADNDDDDDDKEQANEAIEQLLAPWRTTKNFLQATQQKAMLKLYGEGDPSGRGEAFSFIKTSMKGGFKAVGGSAQDAIALKKELGGHSYNVARMNKSYDDAVRGIWDKQKAALGSKIEPTDLDMDGDIDGQEDRYQDRSNLRASSISGTHTPSISRRRDDETATSFSRRSVNSQSQKVLRIVRTVKRDGEEVQEEHIETDPAVIKQYSQIRRQLEAQTTAVTELRPTGDADVDARNKERIQSEIARLEKNSARNKKRKSKNAVATSPGGTPLDPDDPDATPGGKNTQATQRKCANCGQVGHIKTNRKMCPLLNGERKTEDGFSNAAFMGAPPPMT